VQVLGDAVAGAALVRPAGQTLVDDGVAVAVALGQTGHAQQVGAQLVDAVALVGRAHV
jgi:hypothetical protein